VVDELSLGMMADEDAIAVLVRETFEENPDAYEKYTAGKKNIFGFHRWSDTKKVRRKS
jgi:Asp-tRNA(Asn)/Glu-tRNA(Gln) amidotransferase B subunit